METKVVSIPFVGGFNEFDDPDQLQPPEMSICENAVIRRPGRIEKRFGFTLVDGAAGVPATAFDGDAVPSASVEALEAYYGKSGTSAMLVAGSKLYQYVGQDATHGWRKVNDVPSHVGVLHSVSASGGSVIEVDALPSSDNALMLTVWITGPRTGQELSSDIAYQNKTTSDLNKSGNIVYYAVQEIEGGSFVIPPTVLFENTTNPIYNLRVTKCFTGSTKYLAIVAVQNGSTVMYKTLDFSTFTVTGPHTLGTVGQTCFRAFDISGLNRSVLGSAGIVVAYCAADTASSVSGAQLTVESFFVDPTTGVPSFNASETNVLAKAAPGAGDWFKAWAHRGVVLEQEPETGVLALSARVITRYYSAPAVATNQIDGQLWTVLLTVAAGSLTYSAKNAQIPFIGFQSKDEHGSVLGSPIGTTHYSGSVDVRTSLETTSTYSAGPPALPPVPPSASTTPMTITGTLPDGTVQTYVAQWGLINQANPYAATIPQVAINGLEPNKAGFTPVLNSSLGAVGGFPRPIHNYRADAPALITVATEGQVTLIDISSILASLTGFTPGIHTNCPVYNGGTIICRVSVNVNTAGNVTEIAIEDGRPGSPIADPNVPTPITSITIPRGGAFVWPVGGLAYTHLRSYGQGLVAYDVPNRIDRVTPVSYVQNCAVEHCVHRWDVTQLGGVAYIALSSVAASLMTTPNGDAPYGAASPHAQNNMFEVYRWDQSSDRLLVNVAGSATAGVMAGALGGPWRMVSGLRREAGTNTLLCVICPGGDSMQRNSFLVRVNALTAFSISYAAQSKTDAGSETYGYEGNPGVFVESCNLMRVTSAPLNMPALRTSMNGFMTGALRDGSSRGTQEVFVLEYEDAPANWRKTSIMSDYMFVNGGVPTMFDGVTANEVAPMLWPQRDLTSVNWPIVNPQVYIVTEQGTQPGISPELYSCAFYDRNNSQGIAAYGLNTITRPFFAYEAGLKDKTGYGSADGCGWSSIKTYWGGNPAENYEAVYADPRASQFSLSKASYANGWNEAAEQKQHYYGRYQATPRDYGGSDQLAQRGNSAWLLWAPRASKGWGKTSQDAYTPAEAGGDFLLRWTYEYTDGTGRMVRSAPSSALQYTVCAEILGAYYDHANKDNTLPYTGGTVTEFRWGFFAPRMELTNRLKVAATDSQRVSLQPYTTAEPYSTVLYRMPLSSWQSPSAAFVVGRNQTRGVVPFSLTPYSANQPLGYVINNFSLFDGPQKEYNGLLSEPFLYTTGNVLDNVPPPACKAMCIHQNRLVLGGADDPTVVWFSKQTSATDAPGFNDALTITIGDGGPVTGLASLNGNLIIFKEMDIYVVPGTLPDSTGYGPSMGEPFNLPAGVGCIDHRSVVETPLGVFFQSLRGLELLTPALDVEPVTKVRETLQQYPHITGTLHYSQNREVWFLCHSSLVTDATPNPNGKIIVFNYQSKTWSSFTATTANYLARGNFAIAAIGDEPWLVGTNPVSYLTSQAVAYRYDNTRYYDTLPGSVKKYVKMTWATAPIALNQVQGYQRVKRVRLLGTVQPPSGSPEYTLIQLGTWTDYALSGIQKAQWTAAQVQEVVTAQGRAQFEVHVAEQKGQRISVSFTEAEPDAVGSTGFGIAASNLAVVVGLKAGLDKRITTEAKH